MAQIEVDFDVWKALTLKREKETTTMNDVLRRLLNLPSLTPPPGPPEVTGGCVFKGVHLPNGTIFKANYKGQVYTGEIKNGAWVDAQGTPHSSPSAAAHDITGSGIHGWWFWACKRPTDRDWIPLGELRKAPEAATA